MQNYKRYHTHVIGQGPLGVMYAYYWVDHFINHYENVLQKWIIRKDHKKSLYDKLPEKCLLTLYYTDIEPFQSAAHQATGTQCSYGLYSQNGLTLSNHKDVSQLNRKEKKKLQKQTMFFQAYQNAKDIYEDFFLKLGDDSPMKIANERGVGYGLSAWLFDFKPWRELIWTIIHGKINKFEKRLLTFSYVEKIKIENFSPIQLEIKKEWVIHPETFVLDKFKSLRTRVDVVLATGAATFLGSFPQFQIKSQKMSCQDKYFHPKCVTGYFWEARLNIEHIHIMGMIPNHQSGYLFVQEFFKVPTIYNDQRQQFIIYWDTCSQQLILRLGSSSIPANYLFEDDVDINHGENFQLSFWQATEKDPQVFWKQSLELWCEKLNKYLINEKSEVEKKILNTHLKILFFFKTSHFDWAKNVHSSSTWTFHQGVRLRLPNQELFCQRIECVKEDPLIQFWGLWGAYKNAYHWSFIAPQELLKKQGYEF